MSDNETDFTPSAGFDAMASEFAQQLRDGKSPDIDEFASRDQGLAARVQRLFPVLEMMERNGRTGDWSEADLLAAENELQKLDGEKWEAPKQLGDFRLIRQIGRGGMGVVYEAEQVSLGRRVAIKILPASAQFDERRTERFATEAKTSAMLHHTNIVPVFGIGREDGLSFIVMQYINGQPLNHVLRDIAKVRDLSSKPLVENEESTFSNREIVRSMFGESIYTATTDPFDSGIEQDQQATVEIRTLSGSDSGSLLQSHSNESRSVKVRNYFRNVARVGVRVSEALDHAHSYGILHRDIKPSNLLLDEQGAVWVTDFGLAKFFDSPDITRTGEVVGTLRYMPPEQLDNNASSSSDIFGLGITLYEMLTLQPAYPGSDRKRLIEKVSEANPAVPRSIDSRIPRDLETIVMKCIQREPAKRYASVAEVGEDLNRFLGGQPIHARRISTIEKSWKWCCRRPTLAASFAALALSILLGLAGVAWQWNETSKALADSNFATEKAEKHFEQAQAAVFQISEAINKEQLLKSPNLLPVRRKLLRKALDYQIGFAEIHDGNVDVELELANAYLNFAVASNQLANYDESKQSLLDSKTILQSILERDLDRDTRSQATCGLAEVTSLIGTITMLTDPIGHESTSQAVEILLDGREQHELSFVELGKLSVIHRRLGDAYERQNQARTHALHDASQLAFDHYVKAHTLIKEAIKLDVDQTKTDSNFLALLALSHRDLGQANRRIRENEQAVKHYKKAVDLFRKLVVKEPENTTFRFGLAESLNSMAYYYGFTVGDEEMGISFYAESIKEHRKLSRTYPSVMEFTLGESRAFLNSGILYEDEEEFHKAREMRLTAAKLIERAMLFAPDDARLQSSYGKALMGVGLNYARSGDEINAQDFYAKARLQHEKAIAGAPDIVAYRIRLARTIINIADSLREMGDYAAAHTVLLESIDKKFPIKEINYLAGRELLGLTLEIKVSLSDANEDDLATADEAFKSAQKLFKDLAAPKSRTLDRVMSDQRFEKIVASDIGQEFVEWFETTQSTFTSASNH